MKKTYIIPCTSITIVNLQSHLLAESGHLAGDINDVTFGGQSTGGMTSDTKSNYNVWNDDWSND